MQKSTPDRYGSTAITIHWLSAILIFVAIGSGLKAGNALDPDAKLAFLKVHVPFAIIVLLLTVARIVWWWRLDRKPLPMKGLPSWQAGLARAVHLLLYVVILGMLASGIGMMILSGAGPIIFGASATPLPDFNDFLPRVPHGLGARLLMALLAIHIVAALHHHFIRRDGVLRRMWYGRS